MIQPFRDYRHNRHQEAIAWKERTGGKVIGLFCCNVPEEIIHAAGMLPVRLLGHHEESTEANLHFPVNVCPYPKSCFDLALKGGYDYLDGLVVPNVCDIIRAMYGFWKLNINTPYAFFLEVPQKLGATSEGFFVEEIKRFRDSLAEYAGSPITDEAITHSIAVYNENRALLRRVGDLRRGPSPKIAASEVQEMVISSMLMPKDAHNKLLTEFLNGVEGRPDPPQDGVPLFLTASMLDDPDFVELIEECGGQVVADDMPMGSRYFHYPVDSRQEPMAALAHRYLAGIACPRKMTPDVHFQYIQEQMAATDIKGVVMNVLRACDCHLYEYPYLKERFTEMGLPTLFFKAEETEMELEEQRGEIEAFIEMLQG